MLKQRVATALLLGSTLIAVICLGPAWLFSVFMVICFFAGAWEWAGLSGVAHVMTRSVYGIMMVAMMLISNSFLPGPWQGIIVILGAAWWCIALVMIVFYQRDRNVIPDAIVSKLTFGILVLLPAAVSLLMLYRQGTEYLLLFFLLIWLVDSAAYFTGRYLGKHRLASRVSPGKSWEGVIGSMVAAVIMAAGFSLTRTGDTLPVFPLVLVFLVTTVYSVAGDLFESILKRKAGLKDSGSLLPGHGGVMDRIDSLTAAAPVFMLGVSMLGSRA